MFIHTTHGHPAPDSFTTLTDLGLEIQKHSFSRLGVKLWNEMPRYMPDLPKKKFKTVLHQLLFAILKKEDVYFQLCRELKTSDYLNNYTC